MQPPGRSGNHKTTRLPFSYSSLSPAGPTVEADAEVGAPGHTYASCRPGDEKRTSSDQYQQSNQGPVPAFADVFTAGSCCSSEADTVVGLSATRSVCGQHHNEFAHVTHRRSDSDLEQPPQMEPVKPFPPDRVAREKASFESSRCVVVIFSDEDNSSSESTDEDADYGQQSLLPSHLLQLHENWNQHNGLRQEEEVSCSNGNSDGDVPLNCVGGGGPGGLPEDVDEVLKEQQEVFAMLLEIDKQHEEWLAKERDANTGCRPPENDSVKNGSGNGDSGSLPSGTIDHSRKAVKKRKQNKSGSNIVIDHSMLPGSMCTQPTGAPYWSLHRELLLSRGYSRSAMQMSGRYINQSIIKLPSPNYCVRLLGPAVLETNDAMLGAPGSGNAVSKNRPASAFVDVFMAGAHYSSTMHTASGRGASGTIYWQNPNEDAEIMHGNSSTDRVIEEARSFAPGRTAQPKLPSGCAD